MYNPADAEMSRQLQTVAEKIKAMREAMAISQKEMAMNTQTTLEQYQKMESGESDLSFSFIYRCAQRFGMDYALLY